MKYYKFKQLIIRIKRNTLVRLNKVFPSLRDESAAKYFDRLVKSLEYKKPEMVMLDTDNAKEIAKIKKQWKLQHILNKTIKRAQKIDEQVYKRLKEK